jgi:hypothetical protein
VNREERWRLLLGAPADDELGQPAGSGAALERALAALYGGGEGREAGLGASAPRVAGWLGDIRELFPSRVVEVMQ